jgi:hypothetical protein
VIASTRTDWKNRRRPRAAASPPPDSRSARQCWAGLVAVALSGRLANDDAAGLDFRHELRGARAETFKREGYSAHRCAEAFLLLADAAHAAGDPDHRAGILVTLAACAGNLETYQQARREREASQSWQRHLQDDD